MADQNRITGSETSQSMSLRKTLFSGAARLARFRLLRDEIGELGAVPYGLRRAANEACSISNGSDSDFCDHWVGQDVKHKRYIERRHLSGAARAARFKGASRKIDELSAAPDGLRRAANR